MGNVCSSDSASIMVQSKKDKPEQKHMTKKRKDKTKSQKQALQLLEDQEILMELQQQKQQEKQKPVTKSKKTKTKTKSKSTSKSKSKPKQTNSDSKPLGTSKTTSSKSKKGPLICQVLKKEGALPLKNGKVVNPHTGRVIQGGGKLFQELTEGCQKIQKDKIKKILSKEEPIANQNMVVNPKTKYKINDKKGTFQKLTK